MRKAINKGNWIFSNTGGLIGVSTGFDFCAEHEVGIKELQSIAGIESLDNSLIEPKRMFSFFKRKKELKFGLDRTTIINTDKILHGVIELKDNSECYIFGYNISSNHLPDQIDNDFEAYWDERSFLIISKDKDKIGTIVNAAFNKDLAFVTGGKVLEDHAGIRFLIKSRINYDLYEQCKFDDQSIYELKKLNLKIDIQTKLRNAKCKFYACSPRWKNYDTKEIHWWLNPEEQNKYGYGYYTYNELIDWTKGKGPIIKK